MRLLLATAVAAAALSTSAQSGISSSIGVQFQILSTCTVTTQEMFGAARVRAPQVSCAPAMPFNVAMNAATLNGAEPANVSALPEVATNDASIVLASAVQPGVWVVTF